VVLRYVYGTSILWAEETSRFLMIWMTFISSGLVLRHGGHMSIDAIFGWTNVRWHKPLRTFNLTVIIGLSVVICYVGVVYALRSMSQTTPTTGIPFGYVYLGIPLGSSFMVILGLIDFKRHINGERIEDPDGFDPHIGDTSPSEESN
jgi:TRAP-type C4-dicarboxylate transport system permease small subunit